MPMLRGNQKPLPPQDSRRAGMVQRSLQALQHGNGRTGPLDILPVFQIIPK